MKTAALLLAACLATACTQVVTSTTSEVRPTRYALVDLTQPLALHDSAVAYAMRALSIEKIKVQPGEASKGVIIAGPVHFDAEGEQPALDATITVTATTQGSDSKFRIFATSVMPADAIGGVDPRLMALVQRLSRHIDAMIP